MRHLPAGIEEMLERLKSANATQAKLRAEAAPEIDAKRAEMAHQAAKAREEGKARHLMLCCVPERIAEAVAGRLEDTPALAGARAWLKQDRPFLVLTGAPGGGKTVAAAATLLKATSRKEYLPHPLADEAVVLEEYDHRAGFFLPAIQIRTSPRYLDDGKATPVIDRAATVKWLVIDELRAADLKGVGLERFEEVLGERYSRSRRTVITANLSQKELAAELGERLASRFYESALVVDCGDTDLRRNPHPPEAKS